MPLGFFSSTRYRQKWQPKAERGITLIMVLIFMVTLSLIAAVGMRGVVTGRTPFRTQRFIQA